MARWRVGREVLWIVRFWIEGKEEKDFDKIDVGVLRFKQSKKGMVCNSNPLLSEVLR